MMKKQSPKVLLSTVCILGGLLYGTATNAQTVAEFQKKKKMEDQLVKSERMIKEGQAEADTEDIQQGKQTVSKQDIRDKGEQKVQEGERMKDEAEVYLEEFKQIQERLQEYVQSAQFRTWVSVDGKKMSASMREFRRDGSISLILADCRIFDIPLNRFSQKDKDFVFITQSKYKTANQETLIEAINDGDAKSVKAMLTQDLNLKLLNSDGSSPLHIAAKTGNVEIVKALIGANADMALPDIDGKSALRIAWENGKMDAANALLESIDSKNLIDEVSDCGYVVLSDPEKFAKYVPKIKNKERALAFIELKKDNVNFTRVDLVKAISEKKSAIVENFYKAGFNRQAMLNEAIKLNDESLASMLLEKKEASLTGDYQGVTPFQAALTGNHANMIQFLIDMGATYPENYAEIEKLVKTELSAKGKSATEKASEARKAAVAVMSLNVTPTIQHSRLLEKAGFRFTIEGAMLTQFTELQKAGNVDGLFDLLKIRKESPTEKATRDAINRFLDEESKIIISIPQAKVDGSYITFFPPKGDNDADRNMVVAIPLPQSAEDLYVNDRFQFSYLDTSSNWTKNESGGITYPWYPKYNRIVFAANENENGESVEQLLKEKQQKIRADFDQNERLSKSGKISKEAALQRTYNDLKEYYRFVTEDIPKQF